MFNIVPWIVSILPTVWKGAKEIIERKQAIQKMETDAEISIKKAEIDAKIRRAEVTTQVDGEIDKISVQNNGWTDEYLTLMITIFFAGLVYSPVIDVLVGWFRGDEHIFYVDGVAQTAVYYQGQLSSAFVQGLNNLEKVPEYAWLGLGAVVIHGFGMRGMYSRWLDRKSSSKS